MTNNNLTQPTSGSNGILYYNSYNSYNSNSKNNNCLLLAENGDNGFLIQSSGLASREEEPVAPATPENPIGSTAADLDAAQVRGAIVQLFDNGAQAFQQYKLKIRLNLLDGTDPEFIAPLTKRLQNFKKYIPEPYRQSLIEYAQTYRKHIKHCYGHFPYLGKFHFNQGRAGTRQANTVEPNTMAVVWFNTADQHWSFILQIQEFVLEGDLDDSYVNAKQRAVGVKSQFVYKNPQHQPQRPLTWAEQRKQAAIKQTTKKTQDV